MSPPAPSDVPTEVAADTSRAYSIGTVLGSYRLVQQIGAGGMGRVFIAEHVRLGRRVALKILRSELSGNIEAIKRFFAEARTVNRIKHENIIEISDFVEDPHGSSFYIMELLHGMELRVLENRDGVLPIARALGIILQVCRGVGAAHAAGVIHRDLKPDNIFLIEREGRPDFVKLLDFGVAKLTSATIDDASTFKTSAGMVVGTPDYMAPEQALGQTVDHRADIYSLGVILFELVVGWRPFTARTAREVMVQHMVTPAPRPATLNPKADLPPELEELILHCLKKDPRERPESIQDVERRLRDILDRHQPASGGDGRRPSLGWLRRRWPIAVGAALLPFVGVALLIWSHGDRRKARSASASAGARPAAGSVQKTSPASPAPSATAKEPAPTSGVASRLTIEALVPAAVPSSEAAPATGEAGAAASGAPGGAHPPRGASTRRRKPVKLDKDGVVNPFE